MDVREGWVEGRAETVQWEVVGGCRGGGAEVGAWRGWLCSGWPRALGCEALYGTTWALICYRLGE